MKHVLLISGLALMVSGCVMQSPPQQGPAPKPPVVKPAGPADVKANDTKPKPKPNATVNKISQPAPKPDPYPTPKPQHKATIKN